MNNFDSKMNKRNYANFVRPASVIHSDEIETTITGDEARQIYLKEVKDAQESTRNHTNRDISSRTKSLTNKPDVQLSDKDLFLIVQNNDDETLKSILDGCPDKLNVLDDFGWSLLMIACQANSIDTAKELLKRGIDTSIRDKAGNSAQSLVIKNKNYALADVLLSFNKHEMPHRSKEANTKIKVTEEYFCDVCNKMFPDKEEHSSSTLHNLSTSKGKKIPASYVIPQSNRGYQLMLKVGWDRESGLGRDGMGRRYPIKPVQKVDRKGLGHEKRKLDDQPIEDCVKHKNRRKLTKDYRSNKIFEINFRREFY